MDDCQESNADHECSSRNASSINPSLKLLGAGGVQEPLSTSGGASEIRADSGNAFSSMEEAASTFANATILAMRSVNESIGSMSNAFERVLGCFSEFAAVVSEILAPIHAAMQQVIELYPKIDWEELELAAEAWGQYGWAGCELMDLDVLPASQEEADSAGRGIISSRFLDCLKSDLMTSIRKKRDIEEAWALFERGYYKSCSMLVFSLIECELYKRAKREKDGKRRPRSVYRGIVQDEELGKFIVVTTRGALAAFNHLFAHANDFDRSCETDINRNFLMHGMRYRPVRRYHCVKLFLLLRDTAIVASWA